MENLKTQLTKISKNKQNQKKALKSLKDAYICIIYSGIAKGKSIKEIHQELVDNTLNKNTMLIKAMKSVSLLKRKMPKKDEEIKQNAKVLYGLEGSLLSLSGVLAFNLIKQINLEKELSKEVTIIADKKESNSKLDALGVALESKNVFFLASEHNDSAEDHAPWQGKMYINRTWRYNPELTDEIKKAIADYVVRNNVKSVQWVTDKPVYFITRPNCRHYFKELQVKEVLTESVSYLIQKYDMHHEIGKRTYLQTIYTRDMRNLEIMIEKYKERLELHLKMYKTIKNPLLAKAIEKDRFLIQKWEKMKKNP